MHLYTIGYEGSDAERLIGTLVNVGIEVLADVRQLPLSRKKGLSKTPLTLALENAGIEYMHFRDLGDPKAGRDAARSGDYEKFEQVYRSHLDSHDAQVALQNLLKVAKTRTTCMLCFERCADLCHRSYIADEAAYMGFSVYNLVSDRPEMYLKNEFKIPRYNPRQGVAAAE